MWGLRHGERGRPEVLRRMRVAACRYLPELRCANAPGAKFCGDAGRRSGRRPRRPRPTATGAERRLVSVLFADLVGFTTLSEGRDAGGRPRAPVALLRHRAPVIERYGGTVEKFIGDAVMAVWGAPIAQRGRRRARRPCRARPRGRVPTLDAGARRSARAGVLTGEAAVTVGAEGQGMVAGDLVNTAVARPVGGRAGHGARWRGDAALDRGGDRLRGRRDARAQGQGRAGSSLAALHVVAARRRRGPPFGARGAVRRPCRELRLVKEHLPCERRRRTRTARLGRSAWRASASRDSSWEFEKYIDGLAADIWWHRGRCLSYGDGVAFWALAEMVRDGRGSSRTRTPRPHTEKLRAALELHLADPEEREWIEPRLLHLLGLTERTGPRSRGPVRRLATLLREACRAWAAGDGLRGHPLGRRLPARLRRVPPRLGPSLPDLRPHARPAGARGSPPRVPRSDPERHDPPARATGRRGDERSAHRARPRPARRGRAIGYAMQPRGFRSMPSRRCACSGTAASSPRPTASPWSPAT